MKACRVHHFGPPDVISFENVAPASTLAGEALVRIKAAGVGPWDAWIRTSKSVIRNRFRNYPVRLSGTVEAVGPAVTALKPGIDVFV